MFAEVYPDAKDKWRWRIRSGSDTMADSGQGYATKSGAKTGLSKVSPQITDVREFSANPRFSGGAKKVSYDKLRTN